MTRTRRLWGPVLAGLLVAGVLGVGGGGAVAVEPRTVTASIMIPAAAFIPNTDDWNYINQGIVLHENNLPGGAFTAPMSFPVPVVNIKRITVYATDHVSGDVCVSLYRSRPAAHTGDLAGKVCTVDVLGPQIAYTTEISPRQVDTAFHGPFLWVNLSPGVYFYGVKINYSYSPGA